MLVNIIAGPKYVGKSKFVESKSGFKIFEDEIIKSLTGPDYTPTDEQVFVAKMRLVEEALKAGHKKIWVVGKHLTRNERIKMYRHIKEVGPSTVVNVTVLHQTFTMLCQEMLPKLLHFTIWARLFHVQQYIKKHLQICSLIM